jgi:hypothetical protein
MNELERVLLLVGSARRPHSTSESLGSYLLERLGERGFETETLLLHRALKSEASCRELLDATDRADLLVVAFPLYVDTLPYLVTKALELIARHRRAGGGRPGQRLLAIANCGFPEADHNDTALAICRLFTREAGLAWAGGLALGGGPSINGQSLSKVAGMARNAIQSLDAAAEALAAGQPLPPQAVEAMSKPLVPTWAYIWMGGFGWRQQARKHGTQKRLHARPYAAGPEGDR